MRHWWLSIACTLVSLSAWASDAGQVLGHWLTPEDNAVIEIYRDGERFSGRIVSLKEPNYPDGHSQAGQPKRDSQKRSLVMGGVVTTTPERSAHHTQIPHGHHHIYY